MRTHDPAMVFRFICAYKKSHDGNSPTFREIGKGCGISSTFVTRTILRKLEEEGLIRLRGWHTRHIEVVGGKWTAPTS